MCESGDLIRWKACGVQQQEDDESGDEDQEERKRGWKAVSLNLLVVVLIFCCSSSPASLIRCSRSAGCASELFVSICLCACVRGDVLAS